MPDSDSDASFDEDREWEKKMTGWRSNIEEYMNKQEAYKEFNDQQQAQQKEIVDMWGQFNQYAGEISSMIGEKCAEMWTTKRVQY